MREYRLWSKFIFIAGVLISGVLILQMGLYALHVIMHWNADYNLIELCHSMLQSFGFSFAGYILQAVVYQTFFLLVFIVVKQAVQTRKFAGKLQACRDEAWTRRLNESYSTARGSITVIDSPEAVAMAAGVFKPHIVLSTGLLQLLSNCELRAVLHHEWHHAKSSDPAKTFLLTLFASALWYIPILKWFLRNYKIVREVLADDYAMRRMGTPAELGSALFKLLKGGVPARLPMSHVSILDTSINYRIRQIVEPDAKLRLSWPLAPAIISIQVAAALCTMFVIVLY
ncbi:M56 family metallopeptidase [Paenibacillus piri]|uniref:M56 family peptidase n=1 Tax=Paenibacillus piri TaxID=2547395 RepID=A0A4R5KLI0_9BACL|nr:M56 family metallopeptidase [Paenibacillus piri]TDF96366.1 M56 family peptidase [Paenibacillus piri]